MTQFYALRGVMAAFFLFAATILPQVGRAQETNYDRVIDGYFHDCKMAESNLEASRCLDAAYKAADKKLNEVWRKVLALIDKGEYMPEKVKQEWKRQIITGQRAWITFRDAECKGSVPKVYWGGTHASIAALECLVIKTVVRLKDLEDDYLP